MSRNTDFHRCLVKYINSGCLGRIDQLLFSICPRLIFLLNAEKVTNLFFASSIKEVRINEKSQVMEISLQTYEGENPSFNSLKETLLSLKEEIFGAYIHGSLAVNDWISYSDVDALIILKDSVFCNRIKLAKVAYRLFMLQKYFYKIDPFQHHGWFVLTERDLSNYPQTYLPGEIFGYSMSLLPDQGLFFRLYFDPEKQDYDTPFLKMASSIRYQLENKLYPRTLYQLKGLLSRVMLLPALYSQRKTRKGMYKKNSFVEAKKDFASSAWSVMDEVSEIRLNWHYKLNPIRRFIMSRRSPLWIRLKKKIGPQIDQNLKQKLTTKFYNRILDLVNQMENKYYEI